MLDINYIREHPDEVRENIAQRKNPAFLTLLDEIVSKDKEWRARKKEIDELRHERNVVSENINKAKKEGKDIKPFALKAKEIAAKTAEDEVKIAELEKEVKTLLLKSPNLLKDVPYGEGEEGNVVVHEFGKYKQPKWPIKGHEEILLALKQIDIERAAKISGARFNFIKDKLARLYYAILSYGMDFMMKRGYTVTIPPYMMNRQSYEGVTSLDDFQDVMYKIDGEDLYLIATSEHPLTAQFMNEVVSEEELPLKLSGMSACFRKEAGAHGKDTKGIFRVHQFHKIEQVVICKPEDSWKFHEELLKNAEDFFKTLDLKCRTISICTGDIGIVAAKKYDIEAWCPAQQKYREVVSCSNCTDYQANRLNIRYGADRKKVHTLNSTCIAIPRALVAMVETWQQKDGSIKIPKVLQKYCGFKQIGGTK